MELLTRASLVRAGRSVTSLGLLTAVLGLLAVFSPLGVAEYPVSRVGGLVALGAAIEILHGFRRSNAGDQRRAVIGGAITLAMALLLINAPYLTGGALVVLLAGWFAFDAVRHAWALRRARDRRWSALAALGNLAVATLLVFAGIGTITWLVAIAGALRLFGIAWNITVLPVYSSEDADDTVIADLGMADIPGMVEVGEDETARERARLPIDRRWMVAFIATLFVIHASRMGSDGTLLGLVAPAVAVIGDMAIAVLITFGVVVPLLLIARKPTRGLERRAWRSYLRRDPSSRNTLLHRATGVWLRQRLRIAMRLREARYSTRMALERALQAGLPVAAIIAATTPVWGMSWYFDTENWAAGMWNSWASSRTDAWREAMVEAIDPQGRNDFAVTPPGTSGDFSFLVIGDPGEGDASQHALRDQILTAAARDDVRFVVISSDVVYPTGAMKNYEANFWLPFKGVTKPVYAIPGNHDWYDALEAFLATFLTPDTARQAMRARAETDLRLTSTTHERIESLIDQASQLRREYAVPTGFQRAPFFEIQTEHFALLAIDTGVVRRIDSRQAAWLRTALDRSRGKLTMAVLGHPFYAGGLDVVGDQADFASIRDMLKDRVAIVMAGDTHDLEYYPIGDSPGAPVVHHVVNGGGGAYLSFGTALAWPPKPAMSEWAYYPRHDAVVRKIETLSPLWKRPAWWWTRRLGGWPFSAEWLSAAFDYNVAPFYQSFIEVKVEPSADRVRLLPYGVHGRLTWEDLDHSSGVRAVAASSDGALVEWVVPMPRANRNAPSR